MVSDWSSFLFHIFANNVYQKNAEFVPIKLFEIQINDLVFQLTLRKDLPPLVTVAMSDKPMRSHATCYVLMQ